MSKKTLKNFFKKKSWSQMIPNCLIRREMQKKIFFWWRRKTAVNGGGGGVAAVFYERYQNLGQLLTQSKRFYPIISKTKGVAPKIKLLVYHVTRRDILPPPPFSSIRKVDVPWGLLVCTPNSSYFSHFYKA